jgi:hypothetical protein
VREVGREVELDDLDELRRGARTGSAYVTGGSIEDEGAA